MTGYWVAYLHSGKMYYFGKDGEKTRFDTIEEAELEAQNAIRKRGAGGASVYLWSDPERADPISRFTCHVPFEAMFVSPVG